MFITRFQTNNDLILINSVYNTDTNLTIYGARMNEAVVHLIKLFRCAPERSENLLS